MRILTFLIVAFAVATAQSRQSQINIPAACDDAPSQVKLLIRAAIESFDANEPDKSIAALEKILDMAQQERLSGLCRAWVYQWLALNYDDLDSLEIARKYAILSLEKDPEIWREHTDTRLTQKLRKTYQECWDEIQNRFVRKRKSWRVALGQIIRTDFSNRYGVVTGVGTTAVISINNKAEFFNDLLFYVRLQRLRKTIERLTAGFYGEFSLLFPLKDRNHDGTKDDWKRPDKAVSFGPALSYAYQSGWEFGSTFEIARLVIGSGKIEISQTAFKSDVALLSYANFELYIRKWF